MLESISMAGLPDLNSMRDLGWKTEMFPSANLDNVIFKIEQIML